MPRILAFDYGTKRVGIAATDPLKIIASPLGTFHSKDVLQFLKDYCAKEEVELFIVGLPMHADGNLSGPIEALQAFVNTLKKNFPNIPIEREDERYSSKMAMNALIESGIKKKNRKDKSLIDQVSAAIILKSYLERIS